MCTQPIFQIERVEQIKAVMVSILIIITTIFYHNNYIYIYYSEALDERHRLVVYTAYTPASW